MEKSKVTDQIWLLFKKAAPYPTLKQKLGDEVKNSTLSKTKYDLRVEISAGRNHCQLFVIFYETKISTMINHSRNIL